MLKECLALRIERMVLQRAIHAVVDHRQITDSGDCILSSKNSHDAHVIWLGKQALRLCRHRLFIGCMRPISQAPDKRGRPQLVKRQKGRPF